MSFFFFFLNGCYSNYQKVLLLYVLLLGLQKEEDVDLVEGEILLVYFSWTNSLVLFLRFPNASSFQDAQIAGREFSSDFLQPFLLTLVRLSTTPVFLKCCFGVFFNFPQSCDAWSLLQASSNTTHPQGEGTGLNSPATVRRDTTRILSENCSSSFILLLCNIVGEYADYHKEALRNRLKIQ